MIGQDKRVLVEYKAMYDDGTVFESSETCGLLDFTTGEGQVIDGIDEAVRQMEVGETRTVTIPCEKAFGRYDERNIQKRALRYIPNAEQLPVGQRISFAGPAGQKVSALVVKVDDDFAYLDFNNKLADKTLIYELKVIKEVEQKMRRTPIGHYRGMARTEDTHPVGEQPVFNNFLQTLGITPEDVDRAAENIEPDAE